LEIEAVDGIEGRIMRQPSIFVDASGENGRRRGGLGISLSGFVQD
jgi:hypothetical protein